MFEVDITNMMNGWMMGGGRTEDEQWMDREQMDDGQNGSVLGVD